MSATPPDDPVELIRNLLKTQAAFIHEHTGAAREEEAASFELARELEVTLSTESEAVKAAFARTAEQITALELQVKRANVLNAFQTGVLQVLSLNSRGGASTIEKLLGAYEEIAEWPVDNFRDTTALEELRARFKDEQKPESAEGR